MFIKGYGYEHDFGCIVADINTNFDASDLTNSRDAITNVGTVRNVRYTYISGGVLTVERVEDTYLPSDLTD